MKPQQVISKEEYVELKKRQLLIADQVETIEEEDDVALLRDIIDHNPVIQKEIDVISEQLKESLGVMEKFERYCIPDDVIDKYEGLNDKKGALEEMLVDEETYFRAKAKVAILEEYQQNDEIICDYDIKKVVNYLAFVFK